MFDVFAFRDECKQSQSNVTNGEDVFGPVYTSDYDVANQQFVNVIMFNAFNFRLCCFVGGLPCKPL